VKMPCMCRSPLARRARWPYDRRGATINAPSTFLHLTIFTDSFSAIGIPHLAIALS